MNEQLIDINKPFGRREFKCIVCNATIVTDLTNEEYGRMMKNWILNPSVDKCLHCLCEEAGVCFELVFGNFIPK